MTDNKNILSVLMLAYNHEPFIYDAINSILSQNTNFNFDIVIGEDCSSDNTRKIIEDYKSKYPDKFKVLLHNSNVGPHKNQILTTKACTGKYIALLEGDDYWTDPFKLQRQVDFLEANSDYVICYHNSIVVDENNNVMDESRLSEVNKRDYSSDELIKAFKIQPQTMCFRNVIKDFPDEFYRSFGGDKFITSLLGAYGKGKYLSNIKPSAFRVHSGGVNGGEKDLYKKYKRHLSTRLALYQYYERTGNPAYSEYFLFEEVYPAIKKIMKQRETKVMIEEPILEKNLVKEYYSGCKANEYEERRKSNPKWEFEEKVLKQVLNELKDEIKTLADAPVGSGRFLDAYKNLGNETEIYGIDYSEDMLKVAEKSEMKNVSFLQRDIINKELDLKTDITVCYRFLNLINWNNAAKTLINLFSASNKYCLFTVRTINENYTGETFIENKIYLHKINEVEKVISENNFQIEKTFEFADKREGQYTIYLCKRIDKDYRVLTSRINKNLNLIYTYGSSEPKGKMYQVNSYVQAHFIEEISSREEIKKYFPNVYKIQNEFVDAEWVAGQIVQPREWEKIVYILSEVQSINFSGESSFDYVEDIVIPRFYMAHPVIGTAFCNEIIEFIKDESNRYEKKISHPDLIPNNIIKTHNSYKIIDNELLCYTSSHRIDILNMLYNLPEEYRLKVFLKYLEISELNIEELETEVDFLQALWLARQAGSFLVKEKPQSAIEIINRYLSGENILPVDIYSLSKMNLYNKSIVETT